MASRSKSLQNQVSETISKYSYFSRDTCEAPVKVAFQEVKKNITRRSSDKLSFLVQSGVESDWSASDNGPGYLRVVIPSIPIEAAMKKINDNFFLQNEKLVRSFVSRHRALVDLLMEMRERIDTFFSPRQILLQHASHEGEEWLSVIIQTREPDPDKLFAHIENFYSDPWVRSHRTMGGAVVLDFRCASV